MGILTSEGENSIKKVLGIGCMHKSSRADIAASSAMRKIVNPRLNSIYYLKCPGERETEHATLETIKHNI